MKIESSQWREKLVENWRGIIKPTWGYDTARGELYNLVRETFPQAFKEMETRLGGDADMLAFCQCYGDELCGMMEFIIDNWALTVAAMNKANGFKGGGRSEGIGDENEENEPA